MISNVKTDGLYFTEDRLPTPEERAEADNLGIFKFRVAKFVGENETPEPCKYVAGKVPAVYKKVPGVEVLKASKSTPAIKLGASSGGE